VINKIEHIGIAVKDLEKSEEIFEKILGKPPYKKEIVDSEGITTSFFMLGKQKIELLKANNLHSPIHKFIAKRNEGIHHIALHVDSIEKEVNRLEKLGFEFISRTPKTGADNKKIVFLHPKTTSGVLVELCEEI
tara:strand:+ start:1936 stop:2337 length:402 start_codon:yes stop_codon:yes gene_type:complete